MGKTWFIGLLCLGVGSLQAQSWFKGQVVDEHGHAIPGAHIRVVEAGQIRASDERGYFVFSLQPGEYSLNITLIGFDTLFQTIAVPQEGRKVFSLQSATIRIHEVVVDAHRSVTHVSVDNEELSHEDLQRTTSGNLADQLGRLPGITSINFGVGVGKPVIRGLSFNRVMVRSQGITQEGQQWGSDHGLEVDPLGVDRVEVIKGPATLRYGSDALGGVINLRPADPPTSDGLEASVQGIYKSNTDLWGTSAALAGRKGDWYVRARVTLLDWADFRVPADSFTYNRFILPLPNERLKNTAGQERNFAFTLGRERPGTRSSLTWSRYNLRTGVFPGAMGIPREYTLVHDGDFRDIDLPYQHVVHDKITWNSTWYSNTAIFRLDVGAQQNDRQEHSQPHAHGLEFLDTTQTEALGLRLQTFHLNPTLEWRLTQRFTLTTGAQADYQINERRGYEYLIPAYTRFSMGGFALGEYRWSRKWTFTGGIRGDFHSMSTGTRPAVWRTRNGALDLVFPEQDGFDRTFHNASGALGLQYAPAARWKIKANAARSFRMPSIAELASDGIHHGTFRHERGDPNLKAEQGYQADLSVAYRHAWLNWKIAGYYNYFQDYIYLRPTAFFSELPDGGQVFQYTQHNAIYAGFEVSVDVYPYPWLRLGNRTDYVWNENLETELPLPFTPPFQTLQEAEVEWRAPTQRISSLYAGASYRYVAAQERVDRNELTTPEYGLVQAWAGASWSFGRFKMITRLEVQNVFNTPYLNHLSRYRLLNLPEPGRNVIVRVTIPLSFPASDS